jgi:hypothetical protein
MKFFLPLLLAVGVLFGSYDYHGSTTAVVTLVGAHIKTLGNPMHSKYPRKDCPVCEGAGWYWSGDGIKKVDCGYCEPEKEKAQQPESLPEIKHPDKTKVIRR